MPTNRRTSRSSKRGPARRDAASAIEVPRQRIRVIEHRLSAIDYRLCVIGHRLSALSKRRRLAT